MSWLSKIFGGSGAAKTDAEPVEFEGFRISPNPMSEGSKYRIAAVIEKDVNGELKTHQLIRADTLDGYDAAAEASVDKAKKMIKEQGERLFS